MAVKVYIDGVIHKAEEASVSVFDRGFLYGDSVYEVVATAGGQPVDLPEHLARLQRSADAIGLELGDLERLERAVYDTLRAAGNAESYVRIIVTRGGGEIGLDTALADQPRSIVLVRPLEQPSAEMFAKGVALRIVGVERMSRRALDPAIKSGNYLNNILALREARRAGAYEALMCDSLGRVAEGSTSNVFVVRGGVLITPALEVGILVGITRARVLELARAAGLEARETEIYPDEVRGADEVFITSTIRSVLPVAKVDNTALPVPIPGPVTRQLMERYARHVAEQAKKRLGSREESAGATGAAASPLRNPRANST